MSVLFAARRQHPRRALVVCLLIAASVAALSLGALHRPDGARAATEVQCNDILTASVTLTSDLICGDGGPGLIVGKSGITINLNGHNIVGGAPAAIVGGTDVAYTNVTVTNGVISSCKAVIDTNRTVMKITKITAYACEDGMLIEAGGSSVSGSNIHQMATGSGIDLRAPATVTGNRIVQNGADGIYVEHPGSTITGNTILSNKLDGIGVEPATNQTSVGPTAISKNITNGNGAAGIEMTGPGGGAINSNTSRYNATLGIKSSGYTSDDAKNKASGNGTESQCEAILC